MVLPATPSYRGISSNLPIVDAISRAKYNKIYSELTKQQKANVLRAAKQDPDYIRIEGRGKFKANSNELKS